MLNIFLKTKFPIPHRHLKLHPDPQKKEYWYRYLKKKHKKRFRNTEEVRAPSYLVNPILFKDFVEKYSIQIRVLFKGGKKED